jgi:hypothetical protein
MLTTKEFIDLARNNNVCIEKKHILTYIKVYCNSSCLIAFTQYGIVDSSISYNDIRDKIMMINCR